MLLTFDGFEVDLRAGELRKAGKRVRLQEQPRQVLQLLLEKPGELVTREELQRMLWPGKTFVDFDDGLNTAVKKLRDALGDSADQPRYIETIPRRGYRFTGVLDAKADDARRRSKPIRHLAVGIAIAVPLLAVLAWVLQPAPAARTIAPAGVDHKAYELYLNAVPRLNQLNKADNDASIALLEKATAIDPGFALAYAALATEYVTQGFRMQSKERRDKAAVTVAKALALDPKLPQAYLARARMLWTRDNGFAHEAAIIDLKRALSLDPNLSEAHHQLASIYNHVGVLDRAREHVRKAIEIDPANRGARFRQGINLLDGGQWEESLRAMQDSKDFMPTLWSYQTAFALTQLGRIEEARQRIKDSPRDDTPGTAGLLESMEAILAAREGKHDEADAAIRNAITRGAPHQHFHHVSYGIASAYALMNRRDDALRWLKATAETGFPCYPLFSRDRNLDNLREDPRFVEFMQRVERQWKHYASL